MTDSLTAAVHEFGAARLQALAQVSLTERNRAAGRRDTGWAALNQAILEAAVDELAGRRRDEAEMVERLTPCPVRIVGVIRPGMNDE